MVAEQDRKRTTQTYQPAFATSKTLTTDDPLQLLVATILSAQCTDVAVNRATPALFRAFPRIADYAAATPAQIEPLIRSIGLFRSKARALHESACMLMERFGGEVPRTMDELVQLRGVARKTANVVLSNCFNHNEGVVVDTHVERLSHQFGLSRQRTALGIERDLMALFAREDWGLLSHLLIFHGRRVCKARGGDCSTDSICAAYCSEGRQPSAKVPSAASKKKVAGKRQKVARRSAENR